MHPKKIRWVLKRLDPWTPMQMFKIQGVTDDNIFVVHNCKELKCAPNKLHRNTLLRGIFENSAGDLYSHFMYLQGHKCNPGTKVGMMP